MEKAYDLKVLGEMVLAEAKTQAMPAINTAVKGLARSAYMGARNWFAESAKMSESKYDDFFVPLLGHLDQFILPQIEEIDLGKMLPGKK